MSLFENKTVTLPDGAEVLLRSPEVDEAPRLIEFLDLVRRETDFLMYSPEDDLPDEEAERKWVQAHRDAEGGITIVSEADGQVVSICGVDRHGPFAKARHGAELAISIHQAWCGRGLGTILMNELIGWAEACPLLDFLSLDVLEINERAYALYTRHGFEPTGRRRWHIKHGGEFIDTILMSRWVGSRELVP